MKSLQAICMVVLFSGCGDEVRTITRDGLDRASADLTASGRAISSLLQEVDLDAPREELSARGREVLAWCAAMAREAGNSNQAKAGIMAIDQVLRDATGLLKDLPSGLLEGQELREALESLEKSGPLGEEARAAIQRALGQLSGAGSRP